MLKKTKKWICKVCGEKQSLMQEFGNGTSKECREIVQRLNAKTIDNKTSISFKTEMEGDFENLVSKKNKWNKFENDCDYSENADLRNLGNLQKWPLLNILKITNEEKLKLEDARLQNMNIEYRMKCHHFSENSKMEAEKVSSSIPPKSSAIQEGKIVSIIQDIPRKCFRKSLKRNRTLEEIENFLNSDLSDVENGAANNILKKSKWESFV
ncbi:uncharacterized protein LOC129609184 isoform X2 [Condylostylus longicornis]|nr:uncharacterized protein LOC129609184 isoform X2 [Condylostylus longicornis]